MLGCLTMPDLSQLSGPARRAEGNAGTSSTLVLVIVCAGGVLVAASWRWVFLVNLPIGLAALIAGWRLLPEVPGHPVGRPDALSAVLITGGVGALTLGLVEGGGWGWGSTRTTGMLALAALLLGW